MILADQIRHYVKIELIEPARKRGEKLINVNAGDVHQRMKLENRMPAVCSALDAGKFLDYARVTLISRNGPLQGGTAEWVFGLEM